MTNQPISHDVDAASRRLSATERKQERPREGQPDPGSSQAGGDAQRDDSEPIASTVSAFASSVADHARDLPGAATARDAAQDAADLLAAGTDYLRTVDGGQLGRDLLRLVRDHPVPSLIVAATVGFVAGRAVTRES